MTQIKTSCGFEAEVDEKSVDDMRFLEAIDSLQEGDITGFVKIAKMLLKPADRDRLYGMLKDETGRVPVESAVKQITEILSQLSDKKK